jgi:hypothetical protein
MNLGGVAAEAGGGSNLEWDDAEAIPARGRQRDKIKCSRLRTRPFL